MTTPTSKYAGHTPGPWTTERPFAEPGLYVSAADPRRTNPLVCRIKETPEGESNARLIAAAPDLLAACKAALSALEFVQREWKGAMSVEFDECKQLRAAIAKAEGR